MGVKNKLLDTEYSLEKAGVILVRRKKKFEELIMPTLQFISNFSRLSGARIQNPAR